MVVDRQLLAKIAVFFLLGLNVAAYYFFWPKQPTNQEKAPAGQYGIVQVMPPPPERRHDLAKPKEFPAASVRDETGFRVPIIPVKNEKETDEAVSRLLEHIQKEAENQPPANVSNPRTLPPLPAEPLKDQPTNRGEADFAVASALTPKNQPGPWLLSMKKSGTQTLLTAKLRNAPARQIPVEFEILCDRVENLSDDAVQAVGSVTFVGAGFKGACQRLTVPGNAANLVIEGQVRIVPEERGWSSSNGQWQGERMVWQAPPTDANATEFQPAGVLVPHVQPKAILEGPK